MDTFSAYIEQITKIEDKDWEVFSSKLIKREFSRKTKILNIGEGTIEVEVLVSDEF